MKKSMLLIIGIMLLISPIALGQGAQKIYFKTEGGCIIYYDVPDLALIIAECDTVSGQEAIDLLMDLGEAFDIEPDIDAFTIMVPREKKADGSDLKAAYLQKDDEENIINLTFNWEDAGWTELLPDQKLEPLEDAIDMSFIRRHEFEVSQTPQRDSR